MTNEEKKQKRKEYHKKYYEKNKSKYKEYYQENKHEHIEKSSEYYYKNKKHIVHRQNEYQKNKRNNDSFFKLTTYLRSRTLKAVKHYKLYKHSSTMKMLGCDQNTFMEHLQKTGELYDPNFNVYDYDSTLYHIDHIKTFEDVSKGIYTLEEVVHYTNLQILPAEINLSKGGNSW